MFILCLAAGDKKLSHPFALTSPLGAPKRIKSLRALYITLFALIQGSPKIILYARSSMTYPQIFSTLPSKSISTHVISFIYLQWGSFLASFNSFDSMEYRGNL